MREHGAKRPLGSIDKCAWCGKQYTVESGRQKYCSPLCSREADLQWQRDHKKGYHIKSGQEKKKIERRQKQEKICVYCGRTFNGHGNTCSDYCAKENNKIIMCISDIKRGTKRKINRYYEKRENYRNLVNKKEN